MKKTYGLDQELVDVVLAECETIYAQVGLERVYLIGSRARNEAREDSDHDFVLVLSDSAPDDIIQDNGAYGNMGLSKIRKSVKGINIGCSSPDVIFCRISNFLSRMDVASEGFPYKAKHEGIRLK
jgi:hypothetical protein